MLQYVVKTQANYVRAQINYSRCQKPKPKNAILGERFAEKLVFIVMVIDATALLGSLFATEKSRQNQAILY